MKKCINRLFGKCARKTKHLIRKTETSLKQDDPINPRLDRQNSRNQSIKTKDLNTGIHARGFQDSQPLNMSADKSQRIAETKALSFPEQVNQFLQQLSQLGYIGIFAMSFIGASSIIFPIPYTIVIFVIASRYDPILLALFAGAGAALGEFTGYLLGFYGRRILSEERRRKMEALVKLFGRYGPLAIFLFALTPLPDDLLFIPLGMLKYKIIKAFVPAIIGKILMIYILAYFGRLGQNIILLIFGEGNEWVGMIITIILLALVLILLLRIDWERVFQKYMKGRVENKA